MILFYRAEGSSGNYWYEAAIVLYEGAPPATTTHTIADAHVVRGRNIANFNTETFEIPSDGTYFVAFYAGSYDRNGNNSLAASMTVDEVRVPSDTLIN